MKEKIARMQVFRQIRVGKVDHNVDAASLALSDVERALQVVAGIVAGAGGEIYLPIFERLERELAAMQSSDSALQRARMMSASIPTHARASRRVA